MKCTPVQRRCMPNRGDNHKKSTRRPLHAVTGGGAYFMTSNDSDHPAFFMVSMVLDWRQ